jgi:transcriptional regulator with XRE-family HTH domain
MKKLRRLRTDAGVTQYKLAQATGISRTKISHAELGLSKLDNQQIDSIRRFLLGHVRERNQSIVDHLEAEEKVRLRSAQP